MCIVYLTLIFLIFYRNSIKEKEKDLRKRSKNRTTFPKNVLSVGKSNKYIKIQKKIETTHEKSFSTIFLHKIIFSTYRFMWTRADYTKIGMNASPSLYKQIAERREREDIIGEYRVSKLEYQDRLLRFGGGIGRIIARNGPLLTREHRNYYS